MGFFDLFKRTDIDEEIARYKSQPEGVLLDVRTREEYRQAVAALDGEKFFEKSENTP